MTYYIREKITGYRISAVEANNYEEAEEKWLKAIGLRTFGDIEVMSAEKIDISEED